MRNAVFTPHPYLRSRGKGFNGLRGTERELRLPSLVRFRTLDVYSGPPAIKCITPRGSRSAFSSLHPSQRYRFLKLTHAPPLWGKAWALSWSRLMPSSI